jgi:hypothetical protein
MNIDTIMTASVRVTCVAFLIRFESRQGRKVEKNRSISLSSKPLFITWSKTSRIQNIMKVVHASSSGGSTVGY